MMLRTLILALAVLTATSASAAPRKAHKPAAAPAAAVGHIAPGPADTRDPATLVAVLQAAGAKAQVAQKQADTVLVTVTSTAAVFSVQYGECNPEGKACRVALFDSQAGGSPTLAQVNSYNQASAMCRGYQDHNGKSHVVMSTLLFADDTREHLVTNLAAWKGCVADYGAFAKDPVAYLASAP